MAGERVLVIAAHPDDEVLGCGGTIARLSREREVRIVILGEGVSSRYGRREQVAEAELERLKQDASAAAAALGAKSVEFGGLPDNRFDELPLLEVVKRIEALLDELAPETIFTHHPGDLNVDHVVTFRAVLTATRPTGTRVVRDLYAFEVLSSTEWAFQRIEPPFRPSVFIDISDFIETKVRAMETYASEARPAPHPRAPESLRALARARGFAAGCEYAEAFELIRSLR